MRRRSPKYEIALLRRMLRTSAEVLADVADGAGSESALDLAAEWIQAIDKECPPRRRADEGRK